MSQAFILKNQFDLFLDKHGAWIDQAEASQLYRTMHKDEAINSMVEHSVKNPELRIKVVACVLDAKGNLMLSEASAAGHSAIDTQESHLFAAEDTPSDEFAEQSTADENIEVIRLSEDAEH
jgi:hypothetical protein